MRKSSLLKLSNTTLDKEFKIVGTKFDRRRKLTDAQIKQMNTLYKRGETIANLAIMFNVSSSTILYHCDDTYKQHKNSMRSLYAHNCVVDSRKDRCNYKRLILKNNLK